MTTGTFNGRRSVITARTAIKAAKVIAIRLRKAMFPPKPHQQAVDRDVQEERDQAGRRGAFLTNSPKTKAARMPGRNESLEFLDVVEDPLELGIAELGGDQADEDDKDEGRPAAEPDERLAVGVLLDVPLVDVHGQKRGDGIEQRAQGADDRAGDGRQDEAAESGPDQVPDKERIGLVGGRARRRELGLERAART